MQERNHRYFVALIGLLLLAFSSPTTATAADDGFRDTAGQSGAARSVEPSGASDGSGAAPPAADESLPLIREHYGYSTSKGAINTVLGGLGSNWVGTRNGWVQHLSLDGPVLEEFYACPSPSVCLVQGIDFVSAAPSGTMAVLGGTFGPWLQVIGPDRSSRTMLFDTADPATHPVVDPVPATIGGLPLNLTSLSYPHMLMGVFCDPDGSYPVAGCPGALRGVLSVGDAEPRSDTSGTIWFEAKTCRITLRTDIVSPQEYRCYDKELTVLGISSTGEYRDHAYFGAVPYQAPDIEIQDIAVNTPANLFVAFGGTDVAAAVRHRGGGSVVALPETFEPGGAERLTTAITLGGDNRLYTEMRTSFNNDEFLITDLAGVPEVEVDSPPDWLQVGSIASDGRMHVALKTIIAPSCEGLPPECRHGFVMVLAPPAMITPRYAIENPTGRPITYLVTWRDIDGMNDTTYKTQGCLVVTLPGAAPPTHLTVPTGDNQVDVRAYEPGQVTEPCHPQSSPSNWLADEVDGPLPRMATTTVRLPEPRFFPITPMRVLDSRDGTGGFNTPWGPGTARSVEVRDYDRYPISSGGRVRAVVLNVTAVQPTAGTHLTVWPAGEPMPTASNLNVPAGAVRPNLVVVGVLPSNGKVSIFNNSGSVHVIADVVGYFLSELELGFSHPLPPGPGDSLVGLNPVRLLDSRDGTGGFSTPWGSGQSRNLVVRGVGGVAPTATAVILNVTVTGPTAPSHLTIWPTGQAMPVASNLNFGPGETVPNLVIVKAGALDSVSIFNNSGNVHVIADVVGYFTPELGAIAMGMTPRRLLDSRDGTGGHATPWGPAEARALTVRGGDTSVPEGAVAVVVNVTAVSPTAATHLTLWPAGSDPPLASTLNVPAGDVRPNLAIVPVGQDGKVSIYNNSGNVHVLLDVVGYFMPGP